MSDTPWGKSPALTHIPARWLAGDEVLYAILPPELCSTHYKPDQLLGRRHFSASEITARSALNAAAYFATGLGLHCCIQREHYNLRDWVAQKDPQFKKMRIKSYFCEIQYYNL